MNFDKFTIGLHFLLILFMLIKFIEYQNSIVMSSIKYLGTIWFFFFITYQFRVVNEPSFIE